jgi:hypothetical protein
MIKVALQFIPEKLFTQVIPYCKIVPLEAGHDI